MDAVTFMKINLPVRLIEISRHVSGRANVSWHVLSLHIRTSCKSDWSEGRPAKCCPADRQAVLLRLSTTSQFSETQGDESRGSVYVSSRGDAERWPLSRVTDYRSLMLPRRLPRLAEMNHPSAFFCKPSITSDFLATDTDTALPTDTHSYTHTLEEDTAQNLTGGMSSADESTQTSRERRPLSHPAPLCLSAAVFPPHFPFSLSLSLSPSFSLRPHISLHLSLLCQPSFLSPAPLPLPFPLFSIPLHLCVLQVTQFISTPLCFVAQWYISLPCLAGHLAAQHHRASKSLLTF